MNKELNIFTLRMLRDQYHAEHLDTEAEALEAAISVLEDTDSAYAEGWTAAESKYRAMMSDGDCISRQAAIDALKGLPTWWADSGGYYGGAQPPMEALLDPEDAISALENLPSAQPEIIRCKDCRYAHLTRDGKCKYCDTWTDVDGYPLELYVEGEFYCGNAERKTDDE